MARVALIFFGASLAVRLLFLLPVVALSVPPATNEQGPLRRAVAFRSIALDVARLETPSAVDRKVAYDDGDSPPAHSLLLSLGMLAFGEGPGGARLVVALLGALTTPLVFLLALRHTSRRGARIAAGIHVAYPSFVVFAHLLRPETTFVLLLLATAACATRLPRAAPGRGLAAIGVATGVLLGLCALTHASALPFLIAVPAWLAWAAEGMRRHFLLPALVLGACALTVLPWELKVARETGIVTLSTAVRAGAAEADTAPAIHVARAEPRAAAVRSPERLRMPATVDFLVVRRALHAVYPPLPPAAVVLLALLAGAGLVALVGLATWGFLVEPPLRGRSLLLVLLLAAAAPSLATAGVPRLDLPLLALLLPAAGHGALHLRGGAASRARVAACAAVLALLGAAAAWSARLVVTDRLPASTLYADLISRVDRLLGSSTTLADHLVLRATGPAAQESIRIEVLAAGEAPQSASTWEPAVDGPWFELNATTAAGAGPLRLRLESAGTHGPVVFGPVHPGAWRVWRETGIPGIEVYWSGGWKQLARDPGRGAARIPTGGDPPRASETADMERSALAALGYVEFASQANPDEGSGVVRIDEARACPGYNLYASIPEARAKLIDARGRVMREWSFDDADWLVRARLLANGDLLVITRVLGDDTSSYLARLTFEGEELWRATGFAHHDAIETPEGNILVLGRRFRELSNPQQGRRGFQDDSLVLLSPAGEMLAELSLYDLLQEHGAPFRRRPATPTEDTRWSDPFHCNSIQWFDDVSLAARDPLFARGNVLISLRNQNVLLIVDWDAREPVWAWGEHDLLGQHEASLLADGTILLFDNGSSERPYSRILRMDPLRREIVWSWQATPPEDFYSAARGTVQALQNDNLLVGYTQAGEAFELTPEGEIVWRFLNPSVNATGSRATLRIHRYDEAFVDALLERGGR